jgi:hypothetical protein
MIALVRLFPPRSPTVRLECVPDLPTAPAAQYSGLFVRCRCRSEVEESVTWYEDLRLVRPTAVLGLVATPADCAERLGRCTSVVNPVVFSSDLVAGTVPEEALNTLHQRSIEGQILNELADLHGPEILGIRRTLEALISRAVRGGTAARAARDLGITAAGLRRRLGHYGLSPRILVPSIRVRAFELNVESGVDRRTALCLANWSSHEQRRKAFKRVRAGGHEFRNRGVV